MAATPDRADADTLLRLLEIYLSDPVRRARNFWRTIPDGLTFAELREKYPPGTEPYEHIDAMMIFWETVGSLIRHGLLNEELAFDTFLDAPPWKKIEVAARTLREERQNPLELENLELAHERAQQWMARRQPSPA